MTATLVGVDLRTDDIGESFPARGLTVSNVKREWTPKRDGSRFIICPECGARFYRPSMQWGYTITSIWYDHAKGFRVTASGKPRNRYFCSYRCMREAEKIAQSAKEAAEAKTYWLTCAWCGDEFPSKRQSKRTARYCCKDCWEKARYSRMKAAKAAKKSTLEASLMATVLPMMNK